VPISEDAQAVVAAILAVTRIMREGIPNAAKRIQARMKLSIARCSIAYKTLIAQSRPKPLLLQQYGF
jgi:hypothetical protein